MVDGCWFYEWLLQYRQTLGMYVQGRNVTDENVWNHQNGVINVILFYLRFCMGNRRIFRLFLFLLFLYLGNLVLFRFFDVLAKEVLAFFFTFNCTTAWLTWVSSRVAHLNQHSRSKSFNRNETRCCMLSSPSFSNWWHFCHGHGDRCLNRRGASIWCLSELRFTTMTIFTHWW